MYILLQNLGYGCNMYSLFIIERNDDVIRCSRCPRKESRWLATTLLGGKITKSCLTLSLSASSPIIKTCQGMWAGQIVTLKPRRNCQWYNHLDYSCSWLLASPIFVQISYFQFYATPSFFHPRTRYEIRFGDSGIVWSSGSARVPGIFLEHRVGALQVISTRYPYKKSRLFTHFPSFFKTNFG